MRRLAAAIGMTLLLVLAAAPHAAVAAPVPPGQQAEAAPEQNTCAGPLADVGVLEKTCEAAQAVADAPVDALSDLAGAATSTVAGGVLDQLTSWMTDAAAWATGKIGDAIAATTTPELSAGWYRERFGSMAALGLGLATLVAMVALISAAIRRDPDALGATVLGIFRAGVGTGLVLALVALALRVADGATDFVASEAVGRDASRFWATAADTWKKGTDDGFLFESSAVTFLFALVQAVAAILVWIELLLRQAAIYVAVLFLPVALAASIWPALRDWESRLARAVAVLVLLKPVMVIVLSLAGSAAAAAVTDRAESGVGVALAAIVIFALAALSPWALMTMVAPTGEGGWAARAGTEGSRDALRSAGGRVGGTIAGGTARAAAAGGSGYRGRGGSGGFGGSLGGSATAGGAASAVTLGAVAAGAGLQSGGGFGSSGSARSMSAESGGARGSSHGKAAVAGGSGSESAAGAAPSAAQQPPGSSHAMGGQGSPAGPSGAGGANAQAPAGQEAGPAQGGAGASRQAAGGGAPSSPPPRPGPRRSSLEAAAPTRLAAAPHRPRARPGRPSRPPPHHDPAPSGTIDRVSGRWPRRRRTATGRWSAGASRSGCGSRRWPAW
jgi:hypothetical protein